MKLPLYLKGLLVATIALVAWAHFSGEETIETIATQAATVDDKKAVIPVVEPVKKDKEADSIADLFPIYTVPVKDIPVPVTQQISFPFRVAGMWISKGAEIVIITDGRASWLLCDICHKAGFIRPGGLITPAWRLHSITNNELIIESLPGHAQTSLSLNSLKTEKSLSK